MALVFNNISYAVAGKSLLKSCSFSMPENQLSVVLGPNGSGKTTLLRTLSGEVKASTGEVLVDGQDVSNMQLSSLAKVRAMLPQQSQVAFPVVVKDLILLSRYAQQTTVQKNHKILMRVAEQFDLQDMLDRNFQSLSGGEKQRVQLARVFAQIMPVKKTDKTQRYLLLDEPSSALDLQHSLKLMEQIKSLLSMENLSCILVLHDINLAMRYADQVLLMNEGELVDSGKVLDVINEENLKKVFKVNARILGTDANTQRYVETYL